MKKILLSLLTVMFAICANATDHITIKDFLSKADTATVYELTGTVKTIKNTTYGNFYLEEDGSEIYIYGLLDLEGKTKNFASLNIEEGDEVTLTGKYADYNGTAEIKNAQFVSVKKSSTPAVDITNTPETAYTVTKALELITAGEGLSTKVYVKGTVLADGLSISTSYGNATYYISDGTNSIEVYRGYYLKNAKFTSEEQLQDGDDVVVYGQLTSYNGTSEINSGNYLYSLNGKTEDDTPKEEYTCTGDGSFANPYTTEDITKGVYVAGDTISGVWVKGVILGNVNTSTGTAVDTSGKDPVATNLALGNADGTNIIPIQLTTKPAACATVRADLNLVDHADYVGKTVYVYGDIMKYCGAGGVKNTSDYSWDGQISNIQTISASKKTQVIYNVAGQRLSETRKGVNIVNGQKIYIK